MADTELKKRLRIKAPVERVWGLIEAVERAPEWNPLLKTVIPRKNKGRGVGGTSDFEARLNGITVAGQHEVTAFRPNQEYAARCTAGAFSTLRVAVTGKFLLEKVNEKETDLTAILSVKVPKVIVPLVKLAPVQKMLKAGLNDALDNLGNITAKK